MYRLTVVLLLAILFPVALTAQSEPEADIAEKADFFDYDNQYNHAMRAAAESDRAVFIFGYTSWNGSSARMMSDVFSDENLRETFKKYFVTVKINMEKEDGPEIARKYKVRAYPAHLFVVPDETTLYLEHGFAEADKLIRMLDRALEPYFPEGRPE